MRQPSITQKHFDPYSAALSAGMGPHTHPESDIQGLVADLAAPKPSLPHGITSLSHTFPGGSTFLRADGTWQTPSSGPGTQAFPVGSVFIAVVSTDPSTLLGYGTWVAFGAGRVMIGFNASDPLFDSAEETGGAKTVQSAGTVSQPTFTGDALGAHNHAPGTLAVSAHTGTAVADHAAHTHTYTQVPNHVHVERAQGGTTASTSGTHLMTSTATGGSLRSSAQSTLTPTGGVVTGITANPSSVLTHGVTQPSDHTLSGVTSAVSAGAPSGTVSQPTFTGAATSVLPPYITCYFWKRTV